MNKGANKSQIFLLEFIFAVLFFAVCATVCVSAFVKADNLSNENALKNEAIIQAESAAEVIKSCAVGSDPLESAMSALKEYMDAVETEAALPGTADCMIYYNDAFRQVGQEDAAHAMYITMSYEDEMVTGDIRVDGDLFCLTVQKFVARSGR